MKIKITKPGVFDGKGKQIETGTVIDLPGKDVPGWLVGKGEIVGNAAKADAVPVTNPARKD